MNFDGIPVINRSSIISLTSNTAENIARGTTYEERKPNVTIRDAGWDHQIVSGISHWRSQDHKQQQEGAKNDIYPYFPLVSGHTYHVVQELFLEMCGLTSSVLTIQFFN